MQTRRQLLQGAVLLPILVGCSPERQTASVESIAEADCLSQESARGFALVPAAEKNLIVVCGAAAVASSRAPELLVQAIGGKWIIWEASPLADLSPTLRGVFGIGVGPTLRPDLYVEYSWPCPALTRSFLDATSVECSATEMIAQQGNVAVAMKRRIGQGGIVFLGSMLGPNLRAEEPEAHAIAAHLFRIAATSSNS